MATARSPSRNTPSAGLDSVRWQVSRLAEQGFIPSIPAFPTLLGSVALGISPVTVAGAAAFQIKSKGFEPIAFPLRLS
jgi:hypothetical protein